MPPINYKKLSLCTVLPLAVVIIIFFSALFIYDPLSIFHKPWDRPFTVGRDALRLQNLALIREFAFDSVIMGNSYTQNTSAAEAGKIFGGHFFNLSMAGGNLMENSIIMGYVLRDRPVRMVFTLLSEVISRTGPKKYPLENWAFLYDKNIFNDFTAYMNEKFLTCLGRWSHEKECVGEEVDFDRPGAWYMIPSRAARFGGVDNWILCHNDPQINSLLHETLPVAAQRIPDAQNMLSAQQIEDIREYFNDFIVTLAKQYPQTRFIYFFNPSSRLSRSINYRNGTHSHYEAKVRLAVQAAQAIPNLEIYAFDDQDFTANVAFYKDSTHYSPEINSWILQAVSEKKNLLTPDNVETYLGDVMAKVQAYDLNGLNDYIQARLPKE